MLSWSEEITTDVCQHHFPWKDKLKVHAVSQTEQRGERVGLWRRLSDRHVGRDNTRGKTSSMVFVFQQGYFWPPEQLETDNGHPDAPALPRTLQSHSLWTLIKEFMFSRVLVLNLFFTNVPPLRILCACDLMKI